MRIFTLCICIIAAQFAIIQSAGDSHLPSPHSLEEMLRSYEQELAQLQEVHDQKIAKTQRDLAEKKRNRLHRGRTNSR